MSSRSEATDPPRPAPSNGLTFLAILGAIAFLWIGEAFFVTLLFSVFLSLALRPFVSLLERARMPRVIAISLVLAILIGAVVLLVVNVSAQLQQFYLDLPLYQARIRDVTTRATDFIRGIQERTGSILPEDTRGIREVKISESSSTTIRAFLTRVGSTLSILLSAGAVPFLSFLMLKDREKFGRALSGLLRRSPRFSRFDIVTAVSRSLTAYAVGESFVVLIMAAATTLLLMLLKINYFYILGPLAGLCVLIPYVGVIIATLPAVLVAFLQSGGKEAITVFLLYSVLQFLEGNVLTPFIVGGKVRLFPLTVLVAFLFWGTLWGVAGAILAVPLTSAIKVVCENVEGWEPLARLLGEADSPPPPEAI
ncbi:MAG: AI-2E family transporter [Thermoanaerobaculia bacterium]